MENVRLTANDAAESKVSIANLGYYDDPFAEAFLDGPISRRQPLINRGTWARVAAFDDIVEQFLERTSRPGGPPSQILSLGAGLDSRFFRLVQQHGGPSGIEGSVAGAAAKASSKPAEEDAMPALSEADEEEEEEEEAEEEPEAEGSGGGGGGGGGAAEQGAGGAADEVATASDSDSRLIIGATYRYHFSEMSGMDQHDEWETIVLNPDGTFEYTMTISDMDTYDDDRTTKTTRAKGTWTKSSERGGLEEEGMTVSMTGISSNQSAWDSYNEYLNGNPNYQKEMPKSPKMSWSKPFKPLDERWTVTEIKYQEEAAATPSPSAGAGGAGGAAEATEATETAAAATPEPTGAGANAATAGVRPLPRYFEVDFPQIVTRKRDRIRRRPELNSSLSFAVQVAATAGVAADGVEVEDRDDGGMVAGPYRLLAADLRDVAAVESQLLGAGLDPSLPTLVLAECVLVYMDPACANAILAWAASTFGAAASAAGAAAEVVGGGKEVEKEAAMAEAGDAGADAGEQGALIAVFEMINPDDRFGRMMVQNIRTRGCDLPGLEAYPTLASQQQRFLDNGWTSATAIDLFTIYHHFLDGPERQRIEKIEFLDELEEFHLITQHYSVTMAAVGPNQGIQQVTTDMKHRVEPESKVLVTTDANPDPVS